MMTLSRPEREELVLDLYFNQHKNYRQIAEEARICPRDIKTIVDKASNEKERQQHKSLSTQAYELFSKGKTPVEVAIALNIRESEVTQYYREYWSLMQVDALNQIYQEIKYDIWHFVSLYRSAKSAGMGVRHVVKLLGIANNHLPAVEYKYEELQKQIGVLEYDKRSAAQDFQNLTNQTVSMGNRLDSIKLDCEKEMAQLQHLQQERMKQEALIKHFENNNEEYVKIRKTFEEKVISILSNSKMLLKLALLSLTESIRKDPDRYISLIYHNTSPPADYISQYYSSDSYGQQQQYPSQDCIDVLLEEAEKLYNKLVKELVDESINDYVYSILSSLLSPSDEKEQQPNALLQSPPEGE